MIGENWRLVTDESVEFEKPPVEAQNCRKIADHFRGIYRRIYPNLIKEKTEGCHQHVTGWTCKLQDLNRLVGPKISPITGSELAIVSTYNPVQGSTIKEQGTESCGMRH